MGTMDFYNETKWCSHCKKYVRYLMSVQHSYCADCGEQVSMFNKEESEQFHKVVERNKFKAS